MQGSLEAWVTQSLSHASSTFVQVCECLLHEESCLFYVLVRLEYKQESNHNST
jgi:hypothetical protein